MTCTSVLHGKRLRDFGGVPCERPCGHQLREHVASRLVALHVHPQGVLGVLPCPLSDVVAEPEDVE